MRVVALLSGNAEVSALVIHLLPLFSIGSKTSVILIENIRRHWHSSAPFSY